MGPVNRLAQREAIMARERIEIPTLPLLAIRGHLCFRCLQQSEKLLRCTGCQRAFYCSKECQAADWRVAHRTSCKILKMLTKVGKSSEAEKRDWESYSTLMVSLENG